VACLTAVREVLGSKRGVRWAVVFIVKTTCDLQLCHGLCAPFLQCLGQPTNNRNSEELDIVVQWYRERSWFQINPVQCGIRDNHAGNISALSEVGALSSAVVSASSSKFYTMEKQVRYEAFFRQKYKSRETIYSVKLIHDTELHYTIT